MVEVAGFARRGRGRPRRQPGVLKTVHWTVFPLQPRDAPFESRHFSSNQNRDTLKGIPFLMAPQEGLEPTTLRLTAECSAIELLRQMGYENFFSYPYGIRRRPTLPGRVQPSTIGAEGLNFCVRDGNRWNPFAITTGNLFSRSSLSRYPDNCTALIGLLPTALT